MTAKIVCTKCGGVYRDGELIARIDTAYHLWTAKGYIKTECSLCKEGGKR